MSTVSIEKVTRKHFVDVKGELIEVRSTSSPEQYAKGVQVFENKLVKGAKAGTSEYWVRPEDFIPAKRVSAKTTIADLLARNLSADELKAELEKIAAPKQ